MQGFLIFCTFFEVHFPQTFWGSPIHGKNQKCKKKVEFRLPFQLLWLTQRPQGAAFFLRHRHSEKPGVVFPPPLWPRKAVVMHLLPPTSMWLCHSCQNSQWAVSLHSTKSHCIGKHSEAQTHLSHDFHSLAHYSSVPRILKLRNPTNHTSPHQRKTCVQKPTAWVLMDTT